MPNFDYINSTDLRTSLESDYSEMLMCSEAGAWKSAQVLAGSIVECLLIDYLSSSTYPGRSAKDPLKIDLADAINTCRSEKAISDRTADLCSVIRSYRNLIHPGRALRLGEQAPNKTTCNIALGLIELIAEEIARVRRASVGLTAAQILSKLLRDDSSLAILKHLLGEVRDQQKELLLLRLLPEEYKARQQITEFDDDSNEVVSRRLADAYRLTLASCNDEIRRKAAQEFVRILREEDGSWVDSYRNAFFRALDLRFVDGQSLPMVKAHLLEIAPGTHTSATVRVVEDLCGQLEPSECDKWLDPLVRTVTSRNIAPPTRQLARAAITSAPLHTSKAFDDKVRERLRVWIAHYAKQDLPLATQTIESLLNDFDGLSPP